MRKYSFILALGVVLTLSACGSSDKTEEVLDDSIAVQVDTASVTAQDSSVSQIGDNGGAVKPESEPVK